MNFKTIAAMAPAMLVAFSTISADAADANYPEPWPQTHSGPYVFGQFTIGFDVFGGETPDQLIIGRPSEDFVVPFGHVGGKVALRSDATPFGIQIDTDFNGMGTDWFTPTLTNGQSASAFEFNATGHLTYTASDMLKLGTFVGYQLLDLDVNSISNPIDEDVEALLYGAEVIVMPSDHSTFYGRFAFIDIQGESDTTTIAGNALNNFITPGGQTGIHLGGGIHEQLSDHWSAQGDFNFTAIEYGCDALVAVPPPCALGAQFSPGDLEVMDIRGTLNYHFIEVPAILSGQIGYSGYSVSGYCCSGGPNFDVDVITGKVQLTLEFGGPPPGADGTLFTHYTIPGGVR